MSLLVSTTLGYGSTLKKIIYVQGHRQNYFHVQMTIKKCSKEGHSS